MHLQILDSAKIALRTLSARDRNRILGLFASLENWETDPQIQKKSRRLSDKDIYLLRASDGMRIFIKKEGDTIQVVDIARQKTIDQFSNAE